MGWQCQLSNSSEIFGWIIGTKGGVHIFSFPLVTTNFGEIFAKEIFTNNLSFTAYIFFPLDFSPSCNHGTHVCNTGAYHSGCRVPYGRLGGTRSGSSSSRAVRWSLDRGRSVDRVRWRGCSSRWGFQYWI